MNLNYPTKPNYYIDIDGNDRSKEVDNAFLPTIQDMKNDPEFYAELVNDLLFHWVYGTYETPLMFKAKKSLIAHNFNFKINQ